MASQLSCQCLVTLGFRNISGDLPTQYTFSSSFCLLFSNRSLFIYSHLFSKFDVNILHSDIYFFSQTQSTLSLLICTYVYHMCYYPVNLLLFTNNIFLSFSNTSFGFCSCLSFPYSHSIFLFRNLLLLLQLLPFTVSVSLPPGSLYLSLCLLLPPVRLSLSWIVFSLLFCFCFPLTTGNCSISLPLNNMSHDYSVNQAYADSDERRRTSTLSPYPFYKYSAPTSCLLLVLPGLFGGGVNLCPFFLLETHGRGNPAQFFCPDCLNFPGRRTSRNFLASTD